jgi:hypothetical protein
MKSALSGTWQDELVLPVLPHGNCDLTADDHAFWLEAGTDHKARFFWDGNAGEPFEFLPQHDGSLFAWASGDRHIAYYGKRGGRFFVGVDGSERGPYDGITRSVPPTFSADGSRLAYGVFVGDATRLVLDDAFAATWRPAPFRPLFSRDGTRFAFVAENREVKKAGDRKDYRQWVVLDGVEQPSADGIVYAPTPGIGFSPDGRRFQYTRIDGDRLHLVVDGVDWPSASNVGAATFSPDSSRLACVAGRPGQFRLMVEGIDAGPAFDAVGPPAFSPDNRRLGYVGARGKGRLTVLVDGVEGPDHHEAWCNLVFSPDSQRVAYLAQERGTGFLARPGAWVLVVDGQTSGDWDEVSSLPHFSPDSRRVAFSGRRGKAFSTVVDGSPTLAFDQVSPPEFSSSGRLGYLGVSGAEKDPRRRYQVVVEGIDMPVMDAMAQPDGVHAFHFSPDGEHVASFGRFDGIWHPIVDGRVGPGGIGVGRARFESDLVSFGAVAPDGLHRVTTRI